MSPEQKSLISQLLRQADDGRLAENATITFRVSGGTHGKRLDKSVSITANGAARVRVTDELRSSGTDVRMELGHERVLHLLREIGLSLSDLLRKEEASFVPDSLVGSVSVGIGNEVETYYFLADEEMYVDEGRRVPTGVRRILDRFQAIEDECAARCQRGGESGQ